MIKIKYIILGFLSFLFVSCADDLNVENPNEPTLEVLQTEEGVKRLMLGVFSSEFNFNYIWLAQANHEAMGDAMFIPWGNFGWRWLNQPTSITLDDGTIVTPPEGGTQAEQVAIFNERAQGDNNPVLAEWINMYDYNNLANLILENVDGISFSGDSDNKVAAIKAFAYYFKGFAYSRIGSMYSAGLINDVAGETTDTYVDNSDIIAEANENFDLAISELSSISNDAAYNEIMSAAIPTFMQEGGLPSAELLIRDINTYKARNLLVNTKLADMTATEWNTILSLTENGLQNGDINIDWRSAAENGAFNQTVWNPYRILIGWHFVSPRMIQDFKDGDNRYTRNFTLGDVNANVRGRGIQYGTEHTMIAIEDGGDYASLEAGLATLPLGTSWEENHLMRAEALIMTGSIDEGLALIDEVRSSQESGLAAVSGQGLSMEDAYEELRRERRIGLFFKGLAFYDARRWGVIDDVSEGGGREGAVVFDASGVKNTNATINYNYLNYFPVPDNELDFNPASASSVPVGPE